LQPKQNIENEQKIAKQCPQILQNRVHYKVRV
jgi:hypothetical protein